MEVVNIGKIIDWIRYVLSKGTNTFALDSDLCNTAMGEIYFKEMGINTCINLIANTMASTEFLTFQEGKETKGENYYLLNIEPNQNQSASTFWKKVIHKLIYDNECLIIQGDRGHLYIADSFDKDDETIFYQNKYSNIIINDVKMNRSYLEKEVIFLKLNNSNIKCVIDKLNSTYNDLFEMSKRSILKNSTTKGIVKLETLFSQTDEKQQALQQMLSERFKTFITTDKNAILPLNKGMDYEELSSGAKEVSTRDFTALANDIIDNVAIAFNIPPILLRGNIADSSEALNNFIMFSLKPILKIITDEFNRKLYGKASYLKNSYIKVDTNKIKLLDISELATTIDVLFRTGTNTINDNLRLLGEEPSDEEICNIRFISKNYMTGEENIGGESKEREN